ncbi:MAG: DUF3126 family protein [Micavibrio sp.]|nr:MAG: DUF3126 family protein [Micavibrio sp.]
MGQEEIIKLQNYLRRTFGTDRIRLMPRKEASDSVEVLLGEEFIAVIYKNVEEGETSYDMNMSILDIDLAAAAS